MLNYVLQYIQDNFVLVLTLSALVIIFAYHFKCLKKLIIFGLAFVSVYYVISKLTFLGVINNKLYNFIASTIYYFLYYLETYSTLCIAVKEFSIIRGFAISPILFISTLVATLYSASGFFACVVLFMTFAKIYEKEILQLFKKIEMGIKKFIFENKINSFDKIIMNC